MHTHTHMCTLALAFLLVKFLCSLKIDLFVPNFLQLASIFSFFLSQFVFYCFTASTGMSSHFFHKYKIQVCMHIGPRKHHGLSKLPVRP